MQKYNYGLTYPWTPQQTTFNIWIVSSNFKCASYPDGKEQLSTPFILVSRSPEILSKEKE